MKGKDLKSKSEIVNIKGKSYKLALDMNALCELEEIYGDIKSAVSLFKEKPIRTVRNFIYAMLKSQDPKLTVSKAGALIDTTNFNQVVDAITVLIDEAFPPEEEMEEIEEQEEVEIKNV